MKDYEDIEFFAYHNVIRMALYHGYSFDEQLESFLSDDMLSEKSLTLRSGESITWGDWYAASAGNFTEEFSIFIRAVHDLIDTPEFSKPSTPVFVSSHSGSSDYFTVSMVKSFVKDYLGE